MRSKRNDSTRRKRGAATCERASPGQRLAQQDVDASADELVAYLRLWADVWPRREQSDWSALYLCGQLARQAVERKTIETTALTLKGPDENAMRGLQQFIGQSEWAVRPKRERLQQLVGGWLGEPEAVLIFDGSGFPKQGKQSVGVAPSIVARWGRLPTARRGCSPSTSVRKATPLWMGASLRVFLTAGLATTTRRAGKRVDCRPTCASRRSRKSP